MIAWVSPITARATGSSTPIPNAGFEDGTLTGWSRGSQTGTLGASITGNGTGVSVFSGSRLFSYGSRNAMGSPTLSNGSENPYYAPAVTAGNWTFSPNNATYAALLQPKGEQTFTQATAALGLSGTQTSQITAMLSSQAQASGFGSGSPTDAAWITREVELTAGVTYTMSWNYMATDYVPYNDGSITSLVPVSVASTPVITVNNFNQSYALLGFSNPGTGDYSTNSFGSTGWQISTYEVSVTGTYKLGFAVFNLDDTALSPVLMIDSEIGTTLLCSQNGSCQTFGGVEANNDTAPTLPPTTTTEPAPTTTTTTLPPATSLKVTSLDDNTSSGTLRWAITQANAQSGGIYDDITFTDGLAGTITLTSDLPAITQSLSITGNGMTNTIIDGNNLYRSIYNDGQRNIVINNMTFKQGKNTSGGIVWTNYGTFTVNNVKFTASQNYAWHQRNGAVTSFNNCQFTYLNGGINSDYGSTPSAKSLNEADYTNRVYINNSLFDNNGTAVGTERFVKVNNSTFTNNGVALQLQGLNRIQVLNSTFTNNTYAVTVFSWMPTSWTPGADNQLVEGNTFTNNTLAINFNNYFSNGTKTYNGNEVNSWSTVRNNTFENNGTIYSGSGFVIQDNTIVTTTTTTTSTTTTTLVPTTTTSTTTTTTSTTTTIVPEPETTTTTQPAVVLPPVETLPTENTTVSIPDLDLTPVSTPELETTTTTTISPPVTTIIETIFEPVDTPEVDPTPVVIPEDPTPEIIVPKDTQDAADAAVEDIFDGPMSNAGIADAVDNLVADAETPEEMTAVVGSLLDQELSDTQFATVIDSVFSEPLSDENFAAAVNTVFEDPTKLSDAQFEDAVTAVFDGPLSDAQFEDAVTAIFEDVKTLSDEQFDAAVQAVFEEPLSTEQFSAALDNIFDEPITDEKFDSVIDSILDAPISNEQFEELVGVLESDTITQDQVSDAVDSVIENGVTEDQATDLATSKKVLESIDTDQAAEIFDAIPVGDLSTEEEAALVAAVSDAPDEIKDEFETQIDVYGEGLDDYVPTGSQVDVGSRRTLLAATAALSAATVGVGAGTGSSGPSGGSGGSGGGSGGSGGGSGGGPSDGTNSNGRKEDENPEGEEEEDPEIEGPEDQEDNHFTRNSIFKYEEETMKRKFSPWGFIKKFSRETSALAFTISGSVVVFATLSGETRKITIIATGCAFLVHYIHAMIKNDED
jgi:hypothetical protein